MNVLNLRNYTDIYNIDPDAVVVRVDRVSRNYYNPFECSDESKRDWVCDMFIEYALWRIQKQPDWLKELKGKYLACWCAPKRCHAETLLILANLPPAEASLILRGVFHDFTK